MDGLAALRQAGTHHSPSTSPCQVSVHLLWTLGAQLPGKGCYHLNIREPGLREVKGLVQGHTAGKGRSWVGLRALLSGPQGYEAGWQGLQSACPGTCY